MMRTVQLAIADAVYAAHLREALSRSGPWHVECVERPDPDSASVLVLDEAAFERLALPLARPGRVVLICRQDPRLLGEAWDAGIVSVASLDDSLPTVLLAIMAAAMRAAKLPESSTPGGISPSPEFASARLSPQNPSFRPRRCRTP